MQGVPLDVIGHICSFLPLQDLQAFICCSTQISQHAKTELFIQQCKAELFYNRWTLIRKVNSLAIPLSQKIANKISLQKNWTNPEFQPRVYAFPVIDGFVVQADVENNMLYLDKAIGTENYFEIWDTETLTLKNQIKNNTISTKDKYWKGDPFVIFEASDFNPFEFDEGDRSDIWNLNTNELWSMEDRVTYSSYISKNFFVYLTPESDFKVIDLATKKFLVSRRVPWHKLTVDIPNRLLLVVNKDTNGLMFVQYSHDWQEEISCTSIPYHREDEAPIENFWSKVGILVLRKNMYFVSMQIDGRQQSRVFDRRTLQEVYRTDSACSHRQFDTFADFERNGIQGGEIYSFVDKKSYYYDTYNDCKHIIDDLYFQTVEVEEFHYQLSVVRMPRLETIIQLTNEEGQLTEPLTSMIENSLNFEATYGVNLDTITPDAFANEAQIILILGCPDDKIIAVVLDYGDTVVASSTA